MCGLCRHEFDRFSHISSRNWGCFSKIKIHVILLTGSTPCPLPWQADSLPLCHLGSLHAPQQPINGLWNSLTSCLCSFHWPGIGQVLEYDTSPRVDAKGKETAKTRSKWELWRHQGRALTDTFSPGIKKWYPYIVSLQVHGVSTAVFMTNRPNNKAHGATQSLCQSLPGQGRGCAKCLAHSGS